MGPREAICNECVGMGIRRHSIVVGIVISIGPKEGSIQLWDKLGAEPPTIFFSFADDKWTHKQVCSPGEVIGQE
jgi:hypothetical protein